MKKHAPEKPLDEKKIQYRFFGFYGGMKKKPTVITAAKKC